MSADNQTTQLAQLQAALKQTQQDYAYWDERAGNHRALAAEQDSCRARCEYLTSSSAARAQAVRLNLEVARLMLEIEALRGQMEEQRLSREGFLARIGGRAPMLTAEQMAAADDHYMGGVAA